MERMCACIEETVLKILQDLESFPFSFPYALSQQLPGIHTLLHLSVCPGATDSFLYLLLTR